jgi:hypothetical protein
MASVESVELSERFTSSVLSVTSSNSPRNEQTLPPVDRGTGAWSFVSVLSFLPPSPLLIAPQLAAAFLVEALVWGMPMTFGG